MNHRAVTPRFLLGLMLALGIGGLVPNVASYFGLYRPSALAVWAGIVLVAAVGRVILVKRSRAKDGGEVLRPPREVTPGVKSRAHTDPSPASVLFTVAAITLMSGGIILVGLIAMSSMASNPGQVGLLPMIGLGGLGALLGAHVLTAGVAGIVATAAGVAMALLSDVLFPDEDPRVPNASNASDVSDVSKESL